MWIIFRLLTLIVAVISVYIGFLTYSEDSEIKHFNFDKIMGTNFTAIVLGGTGTIGRGIVRALAKEPKFERVTLIARKQVDLPASEGDSNYSKFDQKVMDFDKIPEHGDLFKGYDVGFYAIGVSSALVPEAEYRRIELDNALAIGKLIKEGGCKDVHWITGGGTSKNSWFLFGKVKAQVEEEISNMGFRRVSIYRPGAVLTSDDKPGGMGPKATAVFKAVDFGRWKSVESDVIGRAMVSNALRESDQKVEIFENSHINKMGKLPK